MKPKYAYKKLCNFSNAGSERPSLMFGSGCNDDDISNSPFGIKRITHTTCKCSSIRYRIDRISTAAEYE